MMRKNSQVFTNLKILDPLLPSELLTEIENNLKELFMIAFRHVTYSKKGEEVFPKDETTRMKKILRKAGFKLKFRLNQALASIKSNMRTSLYSYPQYLYKLEREIGFCSKLEIRLTKTFQKPFLRNESLNFLQLVKNSLGLSYSLLIQLGNIIKNLIRDELTSKEITEILLEACEFLQQLNLELMSYIIEVLKDYREYYVSKDENMDLTLFELTSVDSFDSLYMNDEIEMLPKDNISELDLSVMYKADVILKDRGKKTEEINWGNKEFGKIGLYKEKLYKIEKFCKENDFLVFSINKGIIFYIEMGMETPKYICNLESKKIFIQEKFKL